MPSASGREFGCFPFIVDSVITGMKPTRVLTPEEQLAFWQALDRPAELTPRQKQLGRIMRGEK